MLVALIVLLLLGGVAAAALGDRRPTAARSVCLAVLGGDLGLVLSRWPGASGAQWLEEISFAWVPRFGIQVHLAMDGLSFLLVVLTLVLGVVAVGCSWTEIRSRVGFFHLNLMWVLAGVLGVFLALDLLLFYFFWELMLVPMALLIAIWGHERRVYAAIKFFLFTQASGLLLLVAILGLYFVHGSATGRYTFDAPELVGTPMSASTALWLLCGFLVAFAVKLPAVPVHTWLPDAHTEAPTAGSVVLAGLLLKTGAYGLIRFAVPLFPEAAARIAPIVMSIGVAGILYGGMLAFAQTDLKRLVAYTSVSHLGFVLLGVFAWNTLALQGAVMQMLCHGLSTGALFVLVGALQERAGTRDLRQLGGLWRVVPRMGGLALFFAMASLGLPGLGNFVAEFLTLLGAYRVSVPIAAAATLGLVIAAVYSLELVQRAFHGPNDRAWQFADLSVREVVVLGALGTGLLWLGLHPQPVLDAAAPALATLGAA